VRRAAAIDQVEQIVEVDVSVGGEIPGQARVAPCVPQDLAAPVEDVVGDVPSWMAVAIALHACLVAVRAERLTRPAWVSGPGKNSTAADAKTQMLHALSPLYARPMSEASGQVVPSLAEESQAWITALRGPAGPREQALEELHGLLLRAARFELRRRRSQVDHLAAKDVDDLATQAADDALMAILGKLDSFRGTSRFTTWAYKFALLEAGVKARRRAWHGREITIDAEAWPQFPHAGRSAQQCLEDTELLRALRDAVRTSLTPHQREVFSALALNDIPIDVLAERLNTTRGALYKTLHDARRKLRVALGGAGYALDADLAMGGER
jgi:RNA polymerase sigma-70 factor (ECF subfamily)